jgi:protein phosphatase
MKIEIAQPYGFSLIGKRPNNEDSIYPMPDNGTIHDSLYLVCDGVGGVEKGEVASAELCGTFSHSVTGDFNQPFSRSDFKTVLAVAYKRLDELEDPNVSRKMGSTLTLLKFHSGGAMIAHIGDSRVYHIRPAAKQPILFKTEDHSLVATLVKAGLITPEEAAVHPKKNIIHRAVQPHQPEHAEADIYITTDIKPGDYFFLCSDGVLENLTDTILADILQKKVPDKVKIEEIKKVCEGKTKDNYSAWLVRIKNVAKDIESEQDMDIIVLEEVTRNNGNNKSQLIKRTPLERINKWKVILFLSVLFIVFISVYSYQQRDGTKIGNGTDSLKIEESRIQGGPIKAVLPDSSSGHTAKDTAKDTVKMDSISPKGNSNVRVDNAENVVNPKILKPTTKP